MYQCDVDQFLGFVFRKSELHDVLQFLLMWVINCVFVVL